MSDADNDNVDSEANLHLDAERKLMHSVLSQFDEGTAATRQQDLKHPGQVLKAPCLRLFIAPTSSVQQLHRGQQTLTACTQAIDCKAGYFLVSASFLVQNGAS